MDRVIGGNGITMAERSPAALLQQPASRRPSASAYPLIDYEADPNGFAESLTSVVVHRRAQVVAEQPTVCGPRGDRAPILNPPGAEHVVPCMGALRADFIGAPLPVPHVRVHGEPVSSALRDRPLSVVLTTPFAVGAAAPCAPGEAGKPAPVVIEVDLLDLDSPRVLDPVQPMVSELRKDCL